MPTRIALLSIALIISLGLAVRPAAAAAGTKVIAQARVTGAHSKVVRAPNGVRLRIPRGVVKGSAIATIVSLGGRRYDVHVAGEWKGRVAVTVPLRGKRDSILHRIGGVWVAEGGRRGERTVWVTQLSWFSSLSSKAAKALCLTWDRKKFVKCLAEKGIKYIDGELSKWIAEQISGSCTAAVLARAGRGPLSAVTLPLALFFDDACIGTAVDAPPSGTQPQPAPTQPQTPPQTQPQPPASFAYAVYGTCADGQCGVRTRTGPGYSSYSVVGALSDGDAVSIVCQTSGELVTPNAGVASSVWDRLSDGWYVTDVYVNTPGHGDFTATIPRC